MELMDFIGYIINNDDSEENSIQDEDPDFPEPVKDGDSGNED